MESSNEFTAWIVNTTFHWIKAYVRVRHLFSNWKFVDRKSNNLSVYDFQMKRKYTDSTDTVMYVKTHGKVYITTKPSVQCTSLINYELNTKWRVVPVLFA